MRIRMKGLACNDVGHMREGEEHDVETELGRQIVAQGQAEPADADAQAEYDLAHEAHASRAAALEGENTSQRSKGRRG